ncbi:MAG TPA: DNA alkylation repair protein [Chryseolinea sp.]|nr:DNA alkylation repair protein [Chryseolinea sp.]HPH46289.1 DNA alkylation repair protein [Chryseolinea sp.]HPM30860.1 DNA alkylation repair protein [Chryseolinea sp.]
MEPLKEMFGLSFYKNLADTFASVYKPFQLERFVNEVTSNLKDLSLNQRMRNTSIVLHQHLPDNYSKSIGIMKEVVSQLNGGYTTLIFPDFVSVYGLPHFEESLEALKYFTSFGSSEFAVRTFLKHDLDKTLSAMKQWSADSNHHVRRLASEGSRPRLPWSFKLDEIIKKPEHTLPILENLKCDDELYVRKSVANHLNDLSKDSPDYVLKLVKNWDKTHHHTAWIVKRGIRSLLKQGDKKSMAVFNLTKDVKISVKRFSISNTKIRLNDSLQFQFELVSKKTTSQTLMIDYRIHYFKKSGVQLPKVFKLKEITLKPGEVISITKAQRFQDFTTRKLFSGTHTLEIVVNGEVMKRKQFEFLR